MNAKTYHRTLEIDADRADTEARTVPATISTIAPVERDGFAEVLSHDAGAIDLSRAPLPLLEGHDARQTNIGTVTDLKTDGARLRGLVRFGSSARAKELLQDVVDRIVSGLSVGYQITEAEESPDGRQLTATRWMPYEVSITGVPADTNSGFYRSHTMTDETNTTTQQATQQTATTRGADPVQTERRRIAEIMKLTERAGFPGLAAGLIESGASLDKAREQITEALIERAGPEITTHRVEAGNSHGGYGADHFTRAAVDALLLRNRVPVKDPHPGARDLRRTSVIDLAATCLQQRGVDTRGLSGGQIIERALIASHSTSDFPELLSGVANKSLLMGYEAEPATHREWARFVEVPDFKTQKRAKLTEAPALLEVGELAEYQQGTMGEQSESYSLTTYGRIFSISRQALVNDDLSEFTRAPQAFGQAGRRKQADVVYALITGNQAMADGYNLFDSSNHANVVSNGSAPTISALGAMKTLLRRQTGPGGGLLNIVPRFVIVPAALETTTEALLSALQIELDGTNEQVQNLAWVRSLQLVVEPRLDDDSEAVWYMVGSPNQVDTCECATLDGGGGVSIMTREGWEIDGLAVKARMDFSARFLDHRGIVKNPGS